MAIQLCGWMAASALKTEKFYDITGSLTFVSLSLFTAATGSAGKLAPRQARGTRFSPRRRRGGSLMC